MEILIIPNLLLAFTYNFTHMFFKFKIIFKYYIQVLYCATSWNKFFIHIIFNVGVVFTKM